MSEDNFLYWKELVGLENSDFPKLIAPTEEGVVRAKISPSRTEKIRKAIIENANVSVQVNPGWGATTLFHWMKRDLQKIELKLLIAFDFENNPFTDILDEEQFIFKVKWKMAEAVMTSFRGGSFQERYQFEVLNFEDTGKKMWRVYLRDKLRDIYGCERLAERFYQEYPFFEKNTIPDLINYFLTNFQLQTVFMFLFPRKASEDDVLEFVGNIKTMVVDQGILPAALREVYFLTPKMFRILNQDYERPYMEIRYERYTPAEIFGMLIAAYHQERGLDVTISDIFDEQFISKVYDPNLTIDEIMGNVREEVVSFLDGDFSDVPYRLSLSKQIDTEKESSNDYK